MVERDESTEDLRSDHHMVWVTFFTIFFKTCVEELTV
jgi:hypothetical protein